MCLPRSVSQHPGRCLLVSFLLVQKKKCKHGVLTQGVILRIWSFCPPFSHTFFSSSSAHFLSPLLLDPAFTFVDKIDARLDVFASNPSWPVKQPCSPVRLHTVWLVSSFGAHLKLGDLLFTSITYFHVLIGETLTSVRGAALWALAFWLPRRYSNFRTKSISLHWSNGRGLFSHQAPCQP